MDSRRPSRRRTLESAGHTEDAQGGGANDAGGVPASQHRPASWLALALAQVTTDHTVLGRADILALLTEVAERLPELPQRPVIAVVGGSFMALHDLREGTRDVDSATPLDAAVRTTVADVARDHDLAPTWLNDRAVAFFPQGYDTDAEVLMEHARLLVVGPSPDAVFLMKLYATGPDRLHDYDDMVRLWPRCSFGSPEDAAAVYAAAYPHAPDDPGLVGYIAGIVAAASEDS